MYIYIVYVYVYAMGVWLRGTAVKKRNKEKIEKVTLIIIIY